MVARSRLEPLTRAARLATLLACSVLAAETRAAEPSVPAMERTLRAGETGDADEVRRLAREAADACGPGLVSKPCRLATYTLLSRGFAMRSRYQLALDQAREATKLAATSSREAHLSSLLILAGAAARAGELDEAERAVADGRALTAALAAEAEGDAADELLKLRGMFGGPQALVHAARGEYVRAAASQRALVDTMLSFDPEHPGLAVELLALADFEVAAADPAAARAAYADAAQRAEKAGEGAVRDKARAGLARLDATTDR